MTEEKLTLNNGVVLEHSNAAISGDLFLYMYDHGIKEVFDLLIDPANTAKIIYTQVNGTDVTFTGFTRLLAVRDEDVGLITAVLRKEVSE
jgi:hypothetical protein